MTIFLKLFPNIRRFSLKKSEFSGLLPTTQSRHNNARRKSRFGGVDGTMQDTDRAGRAKAEVI